MGERLAPLLNTLGFDVDNRITWRVGDAGFSHFSQCMSSKAIGKTLGISHRTVEI